MSGLREQITVDDVLVLLNDALVADPEAINALFGQRTPCNEKLADHPTIRCGVNDLPDGVEGEYSIGPMGILNGLFGIAETGFGVLSISYGLKCPHGHIVKKGKTIENTCDACDSQIELANIIEFKRVPAEWLTKKGKPT